MVRSWYIVTQKGKANLFVMSSYDKLFQIWVKWACHLFKKSRPEKTIIVSDVASFESDPPVGQIFLCPSLLALAWRGYGERRSLSVTMESDGTDYE
eukprot:g20281.t1